MGGRGKGRPKKKGKVAVSEVTSKLPKSRRKKELERNRVEQSNEEEHDNKRSVGRPPLISGHPMNEEELKERMKHINKVKREDEAEDQLRRDEEQEQEQHSKDLSDKRRAARQTQWENFRLKQEENEKKKLNKEAHRAVRTLEKWEQELVRMLPEALHSQLDLLALSISSFPESECGVTVEKAKLTSREGKSQFYRTLKSVKDLLQSCPFRDNLMFNWASKLSQIDYSDFKDHGLRFISEQDVPVDSIIKEKVEEIRSEVFGNIRREDVRKLHTTLAIRVFKVGSFIMINLSVLK